MRGEARRGAPLREKTMQFGDMCAELHTFIGVEILFFTSQKTIFRKRMRPMREGGAVGETLGCPHGACRLYRHAQWSAFLTEGALFKNLNSAECRCGDVCFRKTAVLRRRLGHAEIHLCRFCGSEVAVGACALNLVKCFAEHCVVGFLAV